ncbi:MAG: DUF2490 domain-containing protein [Acidobacteria bacterium]|nr:DUF2490 domain-containing protein [Acidobacteriota bacterium]MBI3427780.1 DUF2490 domain-containing protein [Acidobacteriota bacterium]
MKAKRCAVALVGLFICIQSVRAQNPPHADDQEWNEVQITKPLTKTRDLLLTGQLRLGREFTHAVEEQLAGAVAFKPNAYLTLTPGYAYVSQQPYAGRVVNQHRLVFSATGKFTWHAFTFANRHQFEQRFVIANRDASVYRQRLTIDHPAHLGAFKFKPFIWDEIRYSSQKLATGGRLGWYRNRLALGLSKPFTKQLTMDFFYLRQDDGVSRPGNIHAAGVSLRIFLPAHKAAPKTTF